ncbi:MAG: alpha/beta hydrolase family protein [Bacteroides cellulosilyticus]
MEPKFLLKDNNGKVICDLATPDLKAVYDAGWKKPERFVAKAADNRTNLYGVMWKPANFDPNKKYPIISVVYPGPWSALSLLHFRRTSKDTATVWAQLGFIVMAVGHRGDSSRCVESSVPPFWIWKYALIIRWLMINMR